MDMSKFLIDDYFTEHEAKAKYMMGSSDPESLLLKEVVNDFSKYDEITLGYELGAGLTELREKLSYLYANVTYKDIAVFNGGEETIYVTMRSLLNKGDEVIVHYPCFQSLVSIAKDIGCNVVYYRPSIENMWEFDLSLLASKVTSKTKMIVLNYPHNPTGACLHLADMQNVVKLCKAHNLYLVSDEMYRFLNLDETYSQESFADQYDKAIALGGFSKTFSAPGLRVGWIATKDNKLMERFLAYRHFTSTCLNSVTQRIASDLLDKKDQIINRNLAIIRSNATILKEFMGRYKNRFVYVPPKGATTAYAKLLTGQTAMEFCMEILAHTGVLLVPSSVLEASDEYIRVGLGRESFPECIQLVGDYLSKKEA